MHGCGSDPRMVRSRLHVSFLNGTIKAEMSDGHSLPIPAGETFSRSLSGSPSNATVPSINIGGAQAAPGSPVNAKLLGRSSDIKKQLSQSFQGNSGVSQGGVSKPKSRRNSAYHVKSEDDGNDFKSEGDAGDDDDKDDQGNERKRRDNINEKIQELLTLIPEKYFQEAAKEGGIGYDEGGSKSTGTRDGKPNKGQILTQAVEYIQSLQNSIDENNRKEVELYLKMKTLEMESRGQTANVPISVGLTSAERALGEIGVGPDAEKYFRKVLAESTGVRKKET